MTATLNDVVKRKPAEQSAEEQAAAELVRLAKEQGLSLTGPDGLLKQLTKTVLETALAEELTEHLGYEKHDPAGAGAGLTTCVTALGPRRCSPNTPARLTSTFPGIGPVRSPRRSCVSGSGGCPASTR